MNRVNLSEAVLWMCSPTIANRRASLTHSSRFRLTRHAQLAKYLPQAVSRTFFSVSFHLLSPTPGYSQRHKYLRGVTIRNDTNSHTLLETTESQSNGLSKSDKIALGVGVPAVLLQIVALFFVVFKC